LNRGFHRRRVERAGAEGRRSVFSDDFTALHDDDAPVDARRRSAFSGAFVSALPPSDRIDGDSGETGEVDGGTSA
jgi:hypothetical protein